MYILEKHILGTQILALGFFNKLQKFRKIPDAFLIFFCVFHYNTLKRPKKRSEVHQIVIPTFWTSPIRTNTREILLNT